MTVPRITSIVILLFVIKTVPDSILQQTDGEQNTDKSGRQFADSLRLAVNNNQDDPLSKF
jgi:hypothetical protein